ncbi:phosphotransferase family protein [Fodinicola acaciae]|uniref:phosphotransferase family protein n=1 Tax=Fodinicola acaciae TaxID=2681555 RepID=UPI001FE5984F|nr:phosphotransferase family protein [Fodinicola acaciae]
MQLADRLAKHLDVPLVEGLTRLSAGANMHTYAFDAVRADGSRRPLILRIEPPDLAGLADMPMEAACIAAAGEGGVPVARIVTWSADPAALGSPFLVQERIDGETIPRRILRGDVSGLAGQCGELLARIHRIDPGIVPVADPLSQSWQQYLACDQPRAALDLGFRWLRTHPAPPARREVVVHGDFRNGNLIVRDGIRAVLDWELAHRGDPLEDLGWLCVRAWRFGSPHPVGGFGSYDELFGAYERVSGEPVDREAFHWWLVFGTLRWGVMCMTMARRHTEGATRSVELAAIGRRVCEQEYDLLMLLDGGA